MLSFACNHMTVPSLKADAFLHLARALDCVGVEFRNDLGRPLFDGQTPQDIQRAAQDLNLQILCLAEVKNFNDGLQTTFENAQRLIEIAQACGAEAVALIPVMLDAPISSDPCLEKKWRDRLELSLKRLQPMLEEANIVGLVEPLGFSNSTLRYKCQVAEIIDSLDAGAHIKIVHDTFHHTLAGERAVLAPYTGLVHLSGVDQDLPLSQMRDHHRELVGPNDRLNTIAQIKQLLLGDYEGAFSFEVFSPNMHASKEPEKAIETSKEFIIKQLSPIAFQKRVDDGVASNMEVPAFH